MVRNLTKNNVGGLRRSKNELNGKRSANVKYKYITYANDTGIYIPLYVYMWGNCWFLFFPFCERDEMYPLIRLKDQNDFIFQFSLGEAIEYIFFFKIASFILCVYARKTHTHLKRHTKFQKEKKKSLVVASLFLMNKKKKITYTHTHTLTEKKKTNLFVVLFDA